MDINSLPKKTVRICAELCRSAYNYAENSENTKTHLKSALDITAERIIWIDDKPTDTQAIVTTIGRTVFLAFQGTTNAADWINNLTADLSARGTGNWHMGFSSIALKTFPEIGKHVKSLLETKDYDDVIITGHSLGGALAVVYCELFKAENPNFPIHTLVTFGQPRVGNKLFMTDFFAREIPFYRFYNVNDIVPDVPSPFGKSDWHHGEGIQMTEDALSFNTSIYDQSATVRFIVAIFVKAFHFLRKTKTNAEIVESIVKFHSMETYFTRIDKFLSDDTKQSEPQNSQTQQELT